jgi:hypothetical protein
LEPYVISENEENNNVTIKLKLPEGTSAKDMKLGHSRNTYHIEYCKKVKEERDGMTYQNTRCASMTKSFPFEILDLSAGLEGDRLTISFTKGGGVPRGYNEIEVKDYNRNVGNDTGNNVKNNNVNDVRGNDVNNTKGNNVRGGSAKGDNVNNTGGDSAKRDNARGDSVNNIKGDNVNNAKGNSVNNSLNESTNNNSN